MRCYAPAIWLVMFALGVQAGADASTLLVPFLLLEALAWVGYVTYRWEDLRDRHK